MIYASVAPEALNTDPAPWQALAGGDRGARCDRNVREGFERLGIKHRHNPRPEYTPATAHPANPILVAVRECKNHENLSECIEEELTWYEHSKTLNDEQEHARRVLTRLANWKEGNR